MKRMLNKLKRGEKGQALIIAMILMLLGSLIIAPMLAYMGSGLKVGKDVHEERMDELYAADAGAEDALWYIHDIDRLKQLVEHVTGGTLPDDWTPEDYTWPLPAYNLGDINGKGVEVTVDYIPYDDYDKYFKITSTATSYNDSGTAISSTTIDSYSKIPDFTNLLDNAITSRGTVDLKSTVYDGDVVYCKEPAPPEDHVIGGVVKQDCAVGWPPADALSEFYLGDVDGFDFNNDTINVKNTPNPIGPLYRDGDLTINKSGGGNALLTLQGTVYVTGKLQIGTTNQNFTLNLNGQTIFVKDPTTPPGGYAVNIGGKTTITGSGCIIAVGGINFQPNMSQGSPEDFLFVMSINGTTFAHPSGNFNGSFAGNVEVQLQPGQPAETKLTWNSPSDNKLNFPGASGTHWMPPQITTWEISTWIRSE
jgi:hypothetical protein